MKYMGSKRWMLGNGLGTRLKAEMKGVKRFVDLFSGSGSVSGFVAEQTNARVYAYDLQEFSAILSRVIIGRSRALDGESIWMNWKRRAQRIVKSVRAPSIPKINKESVKRARSWSARQKSFALVRAYGGHYFSPIQATWIYALRVTVPRREPGKTLALAALIEGASRCAAAPGHTAQPFQVTRTAKKFLAASWELDVRKYVEEALTRLGPRHANRAGKSYVGDANSVARRLKRGDLAFVDPPYSGVHYSRFYHVLEAIAKGSIGQVTGVGRYPSFENRPRSAYSIKTESSRAIESLLETIANKGAKAIITFPNANASNGLSGSMIRKLARKRFTLEHDTVEGRFSTLGGNDKQSRTGNKRKARQKSSEMILILHPKAGRPLA